MRTYQCWDCGARCEDTKAGAGLRAVRCLQCAVRRAHAPKCIRCGAPNTRSAAENDCSAPDYVPFQHAYCAPCVLIRRAERAAASVALGPIAEVRA